MTKIEFLYSLNIKLSVLSPSDREERIGFYSELIDDKTDEGASEEDAVNEIGDPSKIAEQILAELGTLPTQSAKESGEERVMKKVLLFAGAPVWAPIAIALAASAFAIWVSLGAIVISLWAADLAFALTPIVSVVAFFVFAFSANFLGGVTLIGAGMISASLAVLTFLGCWRLTLLYIKLTVEIISLIKRTFGKKEENKQ